MKKEVIFATAAGSVLVLVLGIQTFMIFHLNDRLEGLTGQANQENAAQAQIQNQTPKLPDLSRPKPIPDIEFFKDQPWNPYEEMQHMQNEMQALFGETYSRFNMNMPLGDFTKVPDIDLQEKPDQYIITMNVPGADLSSMSVKLDDRILHISIKTEQTEDKADHNKKGEYRFRERFIGEFHRVITLPGTANANKIETAYHDGVLTITIPKT
jgi:HSP20 family protein